MLEISRTIATSCFLELRAGRTSRRRNDTSHSHTSQCGLLDTYWQSERNMEHFLHEATCALQGVIMPREAEHRILETAESTASLPPSIPCTACGHAMRAQRHASFQPRTSRQKEFRLCGAHHGGRVQDSPTCCKKVCQ